MYKILVLKILICLFVPQSIANVRSHSYYHKSHLCFKIQSKNFSLINLQAFTFRNDKRPLLIMIESDNVYEISPNQIGAQSIKLPNLVETNLYNYDYISRYMPFRVPVSMVWFDLFVDRSHSNKVQYFHYISENNREYFIADNQNRAKSSLSSFHTQIIHQQYLIPNRSYRVAKRVDVDDGYVIHYDSDDTNSRRIIIYNLNVMFNSNTINVYVHGFDKRKSQRDNYFFIEKTQQQNEILFRHRFDGPTNAHGLLIPNDLLTSLPATFVFHNKVYLFDSEQSCVYAMSFSHIKSKIHSQQSFRCPLIPIPYESFFVCSQTPPSLFDNRCSVINQNIPKSLKSSNIVQTASINQPFNRQVFRHIRSLESDLIIRQYESDPKWVQFLNDSLDYEFPANIWILIITIFVGIISLISVWIYCCYVFVHLTDNVYQENGFAVISKLKAIAHSRHGGKSPSRYTSSASPPETRDFYSQKIQKRPHSNFYRNNSIDSTIRSPISNYSNVSWGNLTK